MTMSRTKTIMIIVLAVGTIHAAAELAKADLGPYTFTNITNNSNVNVAGQLQMVVSEPTTGEALFTFTNIGPIGSIITAVYFDDGALLGLSSVINGTGVAFTHGAAPPDLPGGGSIVPVFETTANFLADSLPNVANGIDPGESLGILFELELGKTLADVQAMLAAGFDLGAVDDDADDPPTLRVGLHVQSIDGAIPASEDSDSFVAVPVPGAAILGAIGLGMVGWWKRRAGKAAVA